jgi:CHAT domain-containing protein
MTRPLDCQQVEERDLVDLYLAEELPEEEARRFEQHYFGCERCWAAVQTTLEAESALRLPKKLVRAGQPPQWMLAAAAILVAAVGGIVWLGRTPEGSLVALANDAGKRSPIGARLAGPLSRLAPPVVERGGGTRPNDTTGQLQVDAGRARQRVDKNRSAINLHAAGIGWLLIAQSNEDIDKAVDLLTEANQKDPDDPDTASDLSAARYARWQMSHRDDDVRAAYEFAATATAHRKAFAEAQFNAALALEQVPGASSASIEKAWNAYLELDASSPWSDIARMHREAARTKRGSAGASPAPNFGDILKHGGASAIKEAVRVNPGEARRLLEEELLPRWGSSLAAGDARTAHEVLGEARTLSAALRSFKGESLDADAVNAIDLAAQRHTADLAAGHADYGRARRAFQRREIDDALRLFSTAQFSFKRAGSPFEAAAQMEIAACLFNRNDYAESTRQVVALERDLKGRPGHMALLARVLWLHGLLDSFAVDMTGSLESYGEALRIFEKLNERTAAAFLHELIAQILNYLGDTDGAWEHRAAAFGLLNETEVSEWRHQTLGGAARAALEEGRPALSLAYLDGLEGLAKVSGNAIWECDALKWRALAENQAGDLRAAISDVRGAEAAAQHISDASIRARSQGDVDLVLAKALRSLAPIEAATRATAALTFFQTTGSRISVARCLVDRGRIRLDARQNDAARRDFVAAIEELEQERGRTPEGSLRISFFDTSQAIFDELIGFLTDVRDHSAALGYAERARARALLDDFENAGGQVATDRITPALTPEAIALRLPSSLALVEYRLLPQRMLVWVLHEGRLDAAEVPVTESEIKVLVAQVTDGFVNGNAEEASRSGRRLGDVLLNPIRPYLVGQSIVVFVPDRSLTQVPFSALPALDQHQYLIEEMAVAIAPSASIFVEALRRVSARTLDMQAGALLVGNPAVGPGPFSYLPPLPSVDREIAQVRRSLPRSTVLEGATATRGAFLTLASSHEVVHFAGHAIENSTRPEYSALVLSPQPDQADDGLLTARDISRARFDRAQLVFLAACGTGSGSASASEGTLSLARAFIAAGIPTVIATLWPVDDSLAASVSTTFYRQLASGADPLSALRAAQLSCLARQRNRIGPATWPAFEFIGGLSLSVP